MKRLKWVVRSLVMFLLVGFISQAMPTDEASARAGSKRSFGQRSQPQPGYNRQQPMQQQPVQPSSRGSFMKGLAGGIAGGFLGSMLFSSMGQASGIGGAGGGGGFGLIEILLLGGLGFLLYKLWKSRQQKMAFAGANGFGNPAMARDNSAFQSPSSSLQYPAPVQQDVYYPAARIDSETAEDIFFKVQGAWTRRDSELLRDLAEPDVYRVFEQDMEELKREKSLNKLENISIRQVEVGESWTEGSRDLVRVRFTASLLDYTVDETTGAIKDGSSSVPVRFDESWIFSKEHSRSQWRLAGIEQV